MKKLNVILRTCDRVSLASDRIVPKQECILRCLKSLHDSLESSGVDYTLTVVDDNSTPETKKLIAEIATTAKFIWLPERNQDGLNNKQKSRYSVQQAYLEIEKVPEDDLVYIVEDDYLHYPDSIRLMYDAWQYFTAISGTNVGIFPQDFPELYLHPRNKFNDTYVKPCYVVPGPDRYYRTTWFTHESFLIPANIIRKYKNHFDSLQDIGTVEGAWEGSTISNVWAQPDVLMLMPMKTLAIHVSKQDDIPFYNTDFQQLWESNRLS